MQWCQLLMLFNFLLKKQVFIWRISSSNHLQRKWYRGGIRSCMFHGNAGSASIESRIWREDYYRIFWSFVQKQNLYGWSYGGVLANKTWAELFYGTHRWRRQTDHYSPSMFCANSVLGYMSSKRCQVRIGLWSRCRILIYKMWGGTLITEFDLFSQLNWKCSRSILIAIYADGHEDPYLGAWSDFVFHLVYACCDYCVYTLLSFCEPCLMLGSSSIIVYRKNK